MAHRHPVKVLRTRNSGRWTEARFRAFVVSALRMASRRWPPKAEVLKEARRGTMFSKKAHREVSAYLCAECGYLFTYTQMQVDHKKPVVDPVQGFKGWGRFIERLFCEKEHLQAVCKPCHKRKGDEERKLRVESRRAKKERAARSS